MGDELVALMKKDPELEDFTEEELMIILMKMRVFQMGFTIMAANRLHPEEFDLEKMIEIFNSTAEDVVMATRLRKKL